MLKIIADDLGLNKSVNDGIIFLLKEKKISGASLMANGEEFNDAVGQCVEARLENIGVHLNLVEQKSLVSGQSMSKNHRAFFLKYLFGLVKMSFVEKELRSQIERVIKAGIKPSFLNGNQHLHLLPGIMGIVIRLAKEYKIPYIRLVNEPLNLGGAGLFRNIQLLFLNFLSGLSRSKIRKEGLESNDYFIGFLSAGNLRGEDVKKAKELVQKNPGKTVELGCHPGFEDGNLKTQFKHWGDYNWKKELELLKNN